MIKLLNRMENSKSSLSLQLFPKCLLWPLVIVSVLLQKIYCRLYNVFNCKMAFKRSPFLRLAKWLWPGKQGWLKLCCPAMVLWGWNQDENLKRWLAPSGIFNHTRNKQTATKGRGNGSLNETKEDKVWSSKEQRPLSSRKSAHYPIASS